MKKVLFALLLVIAFACKNETKSKDYNSDVIEKKETRLEVLTAVKIAKNIKTFETVAAALTETTETFSGQPVHLLSRIKSDSKSSYAKTRKVGVEYAEIYKASIIVKKGKLGNLFGLRIQGDYPDRVDAIFDLEKGTVKGVKKTRDFTEETAEIEALIDGWYKCTITAEVTADNVVVFFGATTADKKIDAWTFKSQEFSQVFIVPSSLSLDKVTLE